MRLGSVLVNASGRTLYYFVPERGGRVVCAGTCTSFWPPLLNGGAAPAAGGALPGLLGLIGRPGGTQITYNRWPLYSYTGDMAPDQINGQGIVAFGGSWFVATPGLSG